jgi:hypothetical protein
MLESAQNRLAVLIASKTPFPVDTESNRMLNKAWKDAANRMAADGGKSAGFFTHIDLLIRPQIRNGLTQHLRWISAKM